MKHQNGWLAETENAFSCVYQMLHLRYINYETGAGTYGEGVGMPLTQHGFQNQNVTKARAKLQRDPFSDAVEIINNVARKKLFTVEQEAFQVCVLPPRFLRFQFS